MTQTSISARTWTELCLLALIWGGSFLAIREALDEISVVWSVAHRVFWAALILWAVVWLRRLPLPRGRQWGALLVMGVLNNMIPFTLMAWGQLHIPSGLTAVFNATTAIFGALFAALAFADERLGPRKAVGVVMGFAGVVVAIGPEALMSFDITSLAQLAVIGGAMSYAVAGVWARKHLAGLPPQTAAAGMLTGSALIALPAALLLDGPPLLALGAEALAGIAYYVIFATAGAYLRYYRILAQAGAANTTIVTLLIPPVAIVLGAWARDETL